MDSSALATALALLACAAAPSGCSRCTPPAETRDAGAQEAAPASEADAGPAPERAAPRTPEVFERSGESPGDEALLDALGEEATGLLGESAPLGEGRFLRVAVAPPHLLALVVSDHDGEAQVEARLELPVELLSTAEHGPELERLDLADLDEDGEPEVEARAVYHTHPSGPGGATRREQVFVLDTVPLLRVAFTMLLEVEPVGGTGAVTKLRWKTEDTNGDGHPDIVIAGKQCIGPACEPMDATYTYNPASDSWAERI
jgi:hypothetical protein